MMDSRTQYEGWHLKEFGYAAASIKAHQNKYFQDPVWMAWQEQEKRIAELVNFARAIIFNGDYAFGDIDGIDIQNLALKHGLVKQTTMTEPCGENCACAEYADSFPTQCNRATELIALDKMKG